MLVMMVYGVRADGGFPKDSHRHEFRGRHRIFWETSDHRVDVEYWKSAEEATASRAQGSRLCYSIHARVHCWCFIHFFLLQPSLSLSLSLSHCDVFCSRTMTAGKYVRVGKCLFSRKTAVLYDRHANADEGVCLRDDDDWRSNGNEGAVFWWK